MLQPASPYKTNSSGKKGLPRSTEIVCSFSADRGSQIPPWQIQVKHYQFYARVGISLFWSDLPSCHGCRSKQLLGNCREFMGKKNGRVDTPSKRNLLHSLFLLSKNPSKQPYDSVHGKYFPTHYLSTKRMIRSSLSTYCFKADFKRRTFCPPPAGFLSSPPCHSSSSPST